MHVKSKYLFPPCNALHEMTLFDVEARKSQNDREVAALCECKNSLKQVEYGNKMKNQQMAFSWKHFSNKRDWVLIAFYTSLKFYQISNARFRSL
jgi:hypothetical protein